jgi:hypothetical protein
VALAACGVRRVTWLRGAAPHLLQLSVTHPEIRRACSVEPFALQFPSQGSGGTPPHEHPTFTFTTHHTALFTAIREVRVGGRRHPKRSLTEIALHSCILAFLHSCMPAFWRREVSPRVSAGWPADSYNYHCRRFAVSVAVLPPLAACVCCWCRRRIFRLPPSLPP